MANYANTKSIIAQNIYTNHEGKVTAEMVKTAADEIVNTLIAGGYLYAGVAKLTPTQTNPGSPDANVFYIATEPGTYTNFVGAGGSLVVADGEVAVFKWNGTWSKETTGAATAEQVNQSRRFIEIAPLIDRQGNFITTADLDSITDQWLDVTNGNVLTGSAYYGISDLIPCESIQKFYYSGRIQSPTIVALACFYNENKQFVSSAQAPNTGDLDNYEVSTPANAKYVRFCTYYKASDGVSFAKYFVLANQIPQTFREILAQNSKIADINTRFTILCDSFIGKDGEKIKLQQITASNGVWLSLSGVEGFGASVGTTDYIYVGRISSFSVRNYNKAPSVVALACFYDENKQFISSVQAAQSYQVFVQTIAVPSGAKYVRICTYYDNNNFDFQIIANFSPQDINRDWLGILDAKMQSIPIENPLDNYCNIAMFEKFAVIGDSYASGEIWDSTPALLNQNYALSWGQIIARRNGIECLNLSSGGLTAKSWLTAPRGLALLNSSEAQQLYLCALGLNDASQGLTIGTIADIHDGSPSENPDSFFGNYGKIIEAVKTKAPNAKIVFITTFRNTTTFANINSAIQEIAEHYGVPCLITRNDAMMSSNYYLNNLVGSHPTAALYSAMAVGYERLMSKAMLNNPSYFKDYIG